MADENWYDQFAEDIRGNETITAFEGPEALAKAYIESSQRTWRNDLGEDLASDEELKAVENLGDYIKSLRGKASSADVPAAEDYKLPEGFPLVDFGKFANSAKLSQQQVDQVVDYYKTQSEAQQAAAREVNKQQLNTLLEGWGEDKEGNLAAASAVVRHFDNDSKEMAHFLKATGAQHNPTVLAFLVNIGKILKEDDYIKTETHQPPKKQNAASTLYPNLA